MNTRTIIEIDHRRRELWDELPLAELRALAEHEHVRSQLARGEPIELCPGVRAVATRNGGEGLTVKVFRGALMREVTDPERPLRAHVRAQTGKRTAT